MSKVSLRRLLSFFCCICFMSSFVMHLSENVAFADGTCTINVVGENFSVDEENSVYNYTTNGESSGTMSIIYQVGNDEPMECSPQVDGTITGIPVGANVVFCLEANDGFIPELKINDVSVSLSKASEDQNLYLGSVLAPEGGLNVQPSFSTSDSASIVLNLKCIVDEAIQNANYDDNFKSNWATIEYSDDGGATYKDLSEGTSASGDGHYTFDSSINEIKLKATWTNDIMAALDQNLLQSGSEVTIGKGEHTAIFQQAVYTVAWAYTGSGAEVDENLLTKNGKVSVEPGDGIQGTENENGGIYVVEPGTEVTMHLIPDYGYQFSKGTIGENLEVTPAESQSTFTFTMPKEQVVVGNVFTANPDEVNVLTNAVIAGNISGADKIIASGNASLTVSDSMITSDEKSKITSFASEKGLEPVAYLDMELNNFLLKGTASEKWENMLTTTSSPVEIGLTLSENLRKFDSYAIIKVHGNDISVVDAKYSSSDGILSFETDSFSTYVVAKKSGSGSDGIFSVGNLKTGDQNKFWIYSVMMTASIAGFIFSFREPRRSKFRI